MKTQKSSIVDDLEEKHKERLARAQQELKEDKKNLRGRCSISDVLLFQKWAYRVGKGWYGFSLDDIPHGWAVLIHDFLVWVESQCPDFEIHQIKIKWGGLCCSIETKCDDKEVNELVCSEICKLESFLHHDHLVR